MSQFTPSIKRVDKKAKAKSQFKRGLELVKEQRFEEASAEFEAIIRENPASARAHIVMGNLKYRQKDYDEAVNYYKTAIRLEPLKIQGYLRAAKAYFKQRQLDNALEQLQNVIKLDPKATLAYVGMGMIAFSRGEYDQATKHFSKAVSLNPRLPVARLRLALTYLRQQKLSEAAAQINAALRINANNPDAYSVLGRIYLIRKDFPAALEAFQTSIAQKPEASPNTRLGLIEALIENNQLDEATQTLEELPESEKLAAIRHKLWGDIYHRQGLFKEATEEYNAATLLSAEDISELDDLDSLDIMGDDDADWEQLSTQYRVSTDEAMSEKKYQSLSQLKK